LRGVKVTKKTYLVLLAGVLAIGLCCIANGCAGGGGSATADPHAGLVQYGDEWLTPEEMESRREIERADLGWDFEYKIATAHYMIYSSATLEQTQLIGTVAEALYSAYVAFFGPHFTLPADHPYLKVKLFKDRDEFRAIALPGGGWAEGYYDYQYCNLYYDATAANPYHWFLHEATHQLNYEVAGFSNPMWIEEGIACYFGTSRYVAGTITPGNYDTNSYPVWWLPSYQGGGVIHTSNIVTGTGGPDMDTYFNLYYIQWWSLTHFLFHYDGGKYKQGYMELIKGSGTLGEFELHIGDIDTIHSEWYSYFNGL
jgi:hypothetical protein